MEQAKLAGLIATFAFLFYIRNSGVSCFFWGWLIKPLLLLGAILSGLTWLFPALLQVFVWEPQNLKTKYDAEWALVTGGSSGIGKAMVQRLAGQGLNVVIAAIPDNLLDETVKECKKSFPSQKFIGVGVDLSSPTGSFMDGLKEATDDILIQIVFSNAGYIKTGFFADSTVKDQLDNYHCNSSAAVHLTHHFLQKLRLSGKRGCFVYTSSPASFMPCPFSVMYGATKSFLTEFAASLAPEVKIEGIDISVIHPSPTNSRFYNGTHALDALEFFKKTVTGPEVIADKAIACVGRQVIIDHGWYSLGLRVLLKIGDIGFITEILCRLAHTMGDFKNMHKPPKRNDAKSQ